MFLALLSLSSVCLLLRSLSVALSIFLYPPFLRAAHPDVTAHERELKSEQRRDDRIPRNASREVTTRVDVCFAFIVRVLF